MDYSGQDYPETFHGNPTKLIEGVSLVPSFKGQPLAERPIPIGFQYKRGECIRTERWKLVRYKQNEWELYDMQADSTETNDLAASMPEKVEEMTQSYREWVALCKKDRANTKGAK